MAAGAPEYPWPASRLSTVPAPRALVLVLVLKAAIAGAEDRCFNPLFAVYWSGKKDIRTLTSRPSMQVGLTLCKAYQGKDACCPLAFEDEMLKSFGFWEDHWSQKAQRVRAFKLEMDKVKASATFAAAPYAEQALLDKALGAFDAVLASYGTCFDTVLEYIAGMVCFPCDPEWRQKVFMQGVQVAHVRVHESSHEALWQSCQRLGAAAKELRARAGDAALVKAVPLPMESLEMFESKVSVAEHMANLGLFAMRGPNDYSVKRKLTPLDVRPLPSGGEHSIHPVRDGRLSGFNCSLFPREPIVAAVGVLAPGLPRWARKLPGIAGMLIGQAEDAWGMLRKFVHH